MLEGLAFIQQFNTALLFIGGGVLLIGLILKIVTSFKGGSKPSKNVPESTGTSTSSSNTISNARSIFDKIKYEE